MSTKKPADEKVSNIPPFGLRMLPGMKDRISRAAIENGRSMNAEIVKRLQDTLDFDDHRSYAPTISAADLEAIKDSQGQQPSKENDGQGNAIDQILIELKKLQVTVSAIRYGPNGEIQHVVEPKAVPAEKHDHRPFPDPTTEDVLRIAADRLGYELKPKQDKG